jgi:hypothetical protein
MTDPFHYEDPLSGPFAADEEAAAMDRRHAEEAAADYRRMAAEAAGRGDEESARVFGRWAAHFKRKAENAAKDEE